jgi:GlpG protein
MGWLLLCATGLVGPVANACHAVGLAVGLLAGLPAYLHFRRSHDTDVSFAKGSWADVNVVGWRRFEKRFVEPYAPFWFLAIAIAVLLLDAR